MTPLEPPLFGGAIKPRFGYDALRRNGTIYWSVREQQASVFSTSSLLFVLYSTQISPEPELVPSAQSEAISRPPPPGTSSRPIPNARSAICPTTPLHSLPRDPVIPRPLPPPLARDPDIPRPSPALHYYLETSVIPYLPLPVLFFPSGRTTAAAAAKAELRANRWMVRLGARDTANAGEATGGGGGGTGSEEAGERQLPPEMTAENLLKKARYVDLLAVIRYRKGRRRATRPIYPPYTT